MKNKPAFLLVPAVGICLTPVAWGQKIPPGSGSTPGTTSTTNQNMSSTNSGKKNKKSKNNKNNANSSDSSKIR